MYQMLLTFQQQFTSLQLVRKPYNSQTCKVSVLEYVENIPAKKTCKNILRASNLLEYLASLKSRPNGTSNCHLDGIFLYSLR